MIVEISSGKGGFKLYLEHGQKKGRDLHRDQLDQRIALAGDLSVFELATSAGQADGFKYDHITLSFSEDHVSNEVLQLAVNEFHAHALAAWPQEDRHRVAFYAEAHRPRMTSYTNSETGATVVRLTHIHIGLGKHDLLTGQFIEPLGFLGLQSDNLKYVDAWQESFNARHGLSSPKDNPKIAPEDAVDTLARYTGHRPDALGTFNERKTAFELALKKEIIAKDVTTWAGLSKLLAEHGTMSKIRAGQFNECYRIQLKGAHRAMRLQGVFFQRQFIERSTHEKIEIVTRKATTAYLEQMQPRKAPDYLAKTLAEWHSLKARELRYLHTGSRFYKEVYLAADPPTRISILNQLERKTDAVPSSSNSKNRAIATARNRLPTMPVRDMDAIQKRSEMLLRDDPGVDVRAVPAEEQMGSGMRQANAGDRAKSNELNQPVTQASSMLARLQVELQERYALEADKDKYAEIRKNIDCTQLLNRLSHSHGLNTELYQVIAAKDGTPRIQCGSRALSPSDFLLKELGLPWRQAAPILRASYEHQIGKQVTPARSISSKTKLWIEFKEFQLAQKPVIAERLQAFDAETRVVRQTLVARLKQEHAKALIGLTGSSRKATQSIQSLIVATVKAQFNDERRAHRKTMQPSQAQAWRLFLHALAQSGRHEAALAALQRLDETARSAPEQSITGTVYLEDEEDKKRRRIREANTASVLTALTHVIALNGDITYSQHGHALLRDEGRHLAVLDPDSGEAIEAALLLGREKFGIMLALTGSFEFQQRVVTIASVKGISVKFSDPQLEALRLRLADEKHQGRAIQTPPKQLEVKASQASQDQLAPSPTEWATPSTAVEWISTQQKTVVQPYAQDGSGAKYTVLHVANDGVVIDYGRGQMAIYPLPHDTSVQVGDSVWVDRDGRLGLPATPDVSDPKEVWR